MEVAEGASSRPPPACSPEEAQQLAAIGRQAAALRGALPQDTDPPSSVLALTARLRQATAPARTLATALLGWLHRPQAQPAAAVELAQVAAALPCAYLGCANLAAGSERGRRCSRCRVARYCGRACSHADWRAVHRRMCAALAATRTAQQGGTAAAG